MCIYTYSMKRRRRIRYHSRTTITKAINELPVYYRYHIKQATKKNKQKEKNHYQSAQWVTCVLVHMCVWVTCVLSLSYSFFFLDIRTTIIKALNELPVYYRCHFKKGLVLGKGLKLVRYQTFIKKRCRRVARVLHACCRRVAGVWRSGYFIRPLLRNATKLKSVKREHAKRFKKRRRMKRMS